MPNILLIHADEFRGDLLSIERHTCLSTPNLDHLATRSD
jgi:arylsulfatase A-like enzyme